VERDRPYNPLDKRNLGESIRRALLSQPVHCLPPLEPFAGAGIYVLYYAGPFPAYRAIAARNTSADPEAPIYVGKAVPSGARKGAYRDELDRPAGTVLLKRLREHAESIEQVADLELSDFRCRYLVADDVWIPLGESLLIARYHPLWNLLVEGFGNHDPGKRRQEGKMPLWDLLHAGRWWAAEMRGKPGIGRDDLLEQIEQFLDRYPPN
jgi:hypothetical protein